MRPLVALLLVAACASPDRAFWGVEPQRLTLDGHDYVVYVDRDHRAPRVQVIRMGYVRRSGHQAVLANMVLAAERVSGCTLVVGSVRGDSGVMTGRLDCPRGQT